MKVLSIPGQHHENRYFNLILSALERRGIEVIPSSTRKAASFSYDILHINFPTHYVTENGILKAFFISIILAVYLMAARLLGRKLVYTVHDVVPLRPRHAPLLTRFLRLTHRLTNAFVFISQSSRDEFVRLYPGQASKPWLLALHGPYPSTPMEPVDIDLRRQQLFGAEPVFVVGFIGNIKPYKNIGALRKLPHQVPDGRPVVALVAGRSEHGHEDCVDAVVAALPPERVVRLDRRLTDTELDELIQLVDVVLVPYLKGSNSGVALLVLSNGARLIGSGLPVFHELAETVGAPWAYCSEPASTGPRSLADVVAQVSGRLVTDADRVRLHDYLERVSYDRAAAAIATLYETIQRKRS